MERSRSWQSRSEFRDLFGRLDASSLGLRVDDRDRIDLYQVAGRHHRYPDHYVCRLVIAEQLDLGRFDDRHVFVAFVIDDVDRDLADLLRAERRRQQALGRDSRTPGAPGLRNHHGQRACRVCLLVAGPRRTPACFLSQRRPGSTFLESADHLDLCIRASLNRSPAMAVAASYSRVYHIVAEAGASVALSLLHRKRGRLSQAGMLLIGSRAVAFGMTAPAPIRLRSAAGPSSRRCLSCR